MPGGMPTYGYQSAPPPGYAVGGERAGFGARFGSFLLDGLLYGLLSAVFVVPGVFAIIAAFDGCYTIEFGDEVSDVICPPGKPSGGLIALAVVLFAAAVVVTAVLYVRALGRTGQTWGRKIVGVKVVGKDTGQPLGVGKAFGRTAFAWIISGNFCYLGYLWMLWDGEKQTWHDKVVGAVVVRA